MTYPPNKLKENVDSTRARPKFPRVVTPPFLDRNGVQLTSPVKVLDSDDDPIDMLS